MTVHTITSLWQHQCLFGVSCCWRVSGALMQVEQSATTCFTSLQARTASHTCVCTVIRGIAAGAFSCRRVPRKLCPLSKESWKAHCARSGRKAEKLCACNAVGGLMQECMQRARSDWSSTPFSAFMLCLLHWMATLSYHVWLQCLEAADYLMSSVNPKPFMCHVCGLSRVF